MLQDIVTGIYTSSLVCIQDSFQQSGIDLLKAFAQHWINKNNNHVHFLCYEYPPVKLKSLFNLINVENVHFHDCFTDSRGWLAHAEERVSAADFATVLLHLPPTANENCIVVIDSLSPVIFNHGFARCYQNLHSLVSNTSNGITVEQVVCLVHEDTVPDSAVTLPQLSHLTTTYVEVRAPIQSSKGNPIALTLHKKRNGKVLKELEYYWLESGNALRAEKLSTAVGAAGGDESDLLAYLTTFKLSLGQQEEQARSELVLPYIRTNQQQGGQVFYQPDAADDWDEEDPDDDLDV